MIDRNVEFPNRYRMVKVEGTDDIIDLIPVPGEISDEGTFINKATLLKDATAALFGKGVNAVPDDIFKLLGKYNLHWWSKTGVDYAFNLGDSENVWLTYSTSNAVTIYYADEVSVDESGNVLLVSPVSLSIDLSTSSVNAAQVIKGRYFIPYYNNTASPQNVYFCPYSATVVYAMESYSGIRVNGAQLVTATPSYSTVYVNSSNRNAYPDSGTEGDYIYQYLGIPFDNAVTAPKIATGSYTGTGTYGESNPNSLTFDFVPKFVIIEGRATWCYGGVFWVMDTSTGASNHTCPASLNDKTLTWYSYEDDRQLNASGTKYNYVAIG